MAGDLVFLGRPAAGSLANCNLAAAVRLLLTIELVRERLVDVRTCARVTLGTGGLNGGQQHENNKCRKPNTNDRHAQHACRRSG